MPVFKSVHGSTSRQSTDNWKCCVCVEAHWKVGSTLKIQERFKSVQLLVPTCPYALDGRKSSAALLRTWSFSHFKLYALQEYSGLRRNVKLETHYSLIYCRQSLSALLFSRL